MVPLLVPSVEDKHEQMLSCNLDTLTLVGLLVTAFCIPLAGDEAHSRLLR